MIRFGIAQRSRRAGVGGMARRPVIVVTAVLGLLANPMVALANPAHHDNGTRVLRAPYVHGPTRPAIQGRVEVPSLRTEYSDTYQLPNGQLQAVVSAGPVNYQRSDGSFVPIDDSLKPSPAAGYAFENAAGPFQAEFPTSLATLPVTISAGTRWLSFGLDGASPGAGSATNSGDHVTYRNALPNVSLDEQTTNTGIKESIVLAAAPSTPISFDVAASQGLTLALGDDGSIDATDNGHQTFSIPAPTMSDANGTTSSNVRYTLRQNATGWTLTLNPDPSWLGAAGRAWPVTIDPTVGISSSLYCTLAAATPTTSSCNGSTVSVGYATTGATGPDHAYLNFAGLTSSVPSNSVVLRADLQLTINGTTSTSTTPLDLYRAKRNVTSGATWNKYDGSNNWQAAGGTGTNDIDTTTTAYSTAAGDHVASVGASSSGTIDFYPQKLVQDWVRGSDPTGVANQGLLLKETSDTVHNVISFYGTGTNQPTLTVYYLSSQSGDQSYYPTLDQPLTDRDSSSVNLASGNFLVTDHDIDVAGVGQNFDVDRYYNSRQALYQSLAPGWAMSYMQLLTIQTNGNVVYQAPSGWELPFALNTDGTYQTPPGMSATLTKVSGTVYTLTDNQTQTVNTYTYQTTGNYALTKSADRNGNAITYTLNTSGLPSSATDTQGRSYAFGYTSGLLTSITDTNGPSTRVWGYSYTSGMLTSYTDPDSNTTQYGYTGANLTSITDPNLNVTQIAYTNSQATSITYGFGTSDAAATTVSYNPGTGCTVPCTIVTKKHNAAATSYNTTYLLNNMDEATKVTDALGHNRSTTYDPNANVNTFNGDTTSTLFTITRDLTTQNVMSVQAPTEVPAAAIQAYKTASVTTREPASPAVRTCRTPAQTAQATSPVTATTTMATTPAPRCHPPSP